MHSTKSEILALLKRSDGATVDDLASSIGLAPMTVRQHLTALQRDAFVCADEVRRSTGRPHYRYRLTERGHRRVSDGYDRLLALLLEQAGSLEPADVAERSGRERRAVLFRRAAAALAAAHRRELCSVASSAERLDRVTAVLRAHGGFAEWHDLDGGGIEVRDFGCVFRAIAGDDGPCEWHETFLEGILGGPVRPLAGPGEGAACCRYAVVVAPAQAAQQTRQVR